MDDKVVKELLNLGLNIVQIEQLQHLKNKLSAEDCWQSICTALPFIKNDFLLFKYLYQFIFPDWEKLPAPAWFPETDLIEKTNLARCMRKTGFVDYATFQHWSYEHYADFWQLVCSELNIQFSRQYTQIIDLTSGAESPHWFVDAKMNICDSCFMAAKDAVAIVYQAENGAVEHWSYADLKRRVNQVANSLQGFNLKSGAAIALLMPTTPLCVSIYLGIIKAGYTVVSIADSFAAEEIKTRLQIAEAALVFTQDVIHRDNKQHSLYTKIIEAQAPKIIVLAAQKELSVALRAGDLTWQDFLVDDDEFKAIACEPQAAINILFSSGTTGAPKAIPWNHTTAIKCASDAYFHQDVQPGDVFAWPSNIGWMMGPWLIFACLINRGTLALYGGAPTRRGFGEFIQNAKVNILGLVPSLVKSWRASSCMESLDWQAIKLFSSSGECSNIEDTLYLMTLAGNKPVIEYCGGTEIGGAYITGTLLQAAAPAAFTTAALGNHFLIIDEQGNAAENGEAVLVPPALGLSTHLLNKDHHTVYYAEMPHSISGQILRRHGDQIHYFANGFYRALGRVDDTMNLGGIKVSAAEIERVVSMANDIHEAAAIAVKAKGGGPDQLVIFLVPRLKQKAKEASWKQTLQELINSHLNPLIKIYDIICIDALPRTASNKVMRRTLRDIYKTE